MEKIKDQSGPSQRQSKQMERMSEWKEGEFGSVALWEKAAMRRISGTEC